MKSKTKRPVEVTEAVATPVVIVPTHLEITTRAHCIWERRGYPDNQDKEIWLEAERQLCSGTMFGAAKNPAVTEAAGPLGELGEHAETIEERLSGFGESAANRSATSL